MPDEIAPGYRAEAELSPGTHRCVDPAGRRWVLKRLPDDCLHAGGLHPAIRDRLARVRELPHARVATLATVVRGAGGAYLVWTFVDGVPLDPAGLTGDGRRAVARPLATAVDQLHARGLVHGAISASNVIVTPGGQVWLTHLSPYLWADPAVDVAAVVDLLGPAAGAAEGPTGSLGEWVDRASEEPPAAADGHRRRSLLAAAAVAAAAVAGGVGFALAHR